MIFPNSILYTYDNAGAIRLGCIKAVSHLSKFKFGKLNDIFLVSTKRIIPHKKVKKGVKYRFLYLNKKFRLKRNDSYINFWFNVGTILKKDDPIPLASRIFITTTNELRYLGYKRIIVMGKPNI